MIVNKKEDSKVTYQRESWKEWISFRVSYEARKILKLPIPRFYIRAPEGAFQSDFNTDTWTYVYILSWPFYKIYSLLQRIWWGIARWFLKRGMM